MDILNTEAVTEQFYTIDDIVKLLKISKQTIYNQIHQGHAGISISPFVKLGGRIRFKASDHKRWYEAL